jgi:WS/DGAT/MGAT family acyltransferase
MDRVTNPLTITVVLLFDEPLEYARVESLLRGRLLAYPRFVQRIAEGVLGAHWEPDPYFDLRDHLHRVALPSPAGRAELEELVNDLMSTPLDRARPLWQAHFVERYGEGSALVVRLHHCIADGVALVALMIALTDEGEGVDAPAMVGAPAMPKASGAIDGAKKLGVEAAALGRMLLLPADPRTALRGELGTRKVVAWSGPIALAGLKTIARAAGCKVNDVLCAAVAGGLRSYLAARGEAVDALTVRALVPVNLMGYREGDFGNHFGLVFLPLALGPMPPLDRVRELKRRMDEVKGSPDAVVALGVLAAMGVASTEIEHIGVDIFTRKASLLITNVPGPPMRVHVAGKELSSVIVWAPVSGSVGLGVSLLSYGGEVRVGVSADARVVAEPRMIVEAVEGEVRAQREAMGIGG